MVYGYRACVVPNRLVAVIFFEFPLCVGLTTIQRYCDVRDQFGKSLMTRSMA